MKRTAALAGLVLLLGVGARPAPAQATDPSLLTLERIFAGREFKPETFGPARWLEGGAAYTTLEPPAGTAPEGASEGPGVRELVRYDTASGRREVLVPAARLVPPGATAPLEIADYSWSPDGKQLLLFTETRRVWRTNSRGDYWVLDLGTSVLRKLGQDAPPSTLMFAKFSPDGRRVGYVRENNLYVEDLADGRLTPAHAGRQPDARERDVRLGVRGGAGAARRLALQPGRAEGRVLAGRLLAGEGVHARSTTPPRSTPPSPRSRTRRRARPTPRCGWEW